MIAFRLMPAALGLLGVAVPAGSAQVPAALALSTRPWGIEVVESVAFSAAGDAVLVVGGRSSPFAEPQRVATLWDARTGALRSAYAASHPWYLQAVALAPDGRVLACWESESGGRWRDRVVLRDAGTGRVLREWRAGGSLAFSADGRYLASNSLPSPNVPRPAAMTVHEVSTGRVVFRATGWGDEWFVGPWFLPNSRLAFQNHLGQLRRANLVTGSELPRVRLDALDYHWAEDLPDGRWLFTGRDGRPRLLDPTGRRPVRVFGPELANEHEPVKARASHDGTRVVGLMGKRVTIWDAATGAELGGFDLPGTGHIYPGVRYPPGDRFLLAEWLSSGEPGQRFGVADSTVAVMTGSGRTVHTERGPKWAVFDRAGRAVAVVRGWHTRDVADRPADTVTIHDAEAWLTGHPAD